MRAIPAGVDADTIGMIDALLDKLEAEQRISLPWVVESGSRAWGFPSPDSDYDCRFLYIRREDAYLTPWPARDVIETPLAGDLDVNGWDIAKALRLMLKGNAVILEWLNSPFIYRGNEAFRDAFLALAERHASRNGIARHYLHLGEKQRRSYFTPEGDVALKRLFYALRPAAALRWMHVHPDRAWAPMHFPTLMIECEPPNALTRLVEELLARKAVTRELGSAPLPAEVGKFIDEAFERARQWVGEASPISREARQEVAAFFRTSVRTFGP